MNDEKKVWLVNVLEKLTLGTPREITGSNVPNGSYNRVRFSSDGKLFALGRNVSPRIIVANLETHSLASFNFEATG